MGHALLVHTKLGHVLFMSVRLTEYEVPLLQGWGHHLKDVFNTWCVVC
jgi:hypothetical protein